jgi:hypothetical protein
MSGLEEPELEHEVLEAVPEEHLGVVVDLEAEVDLLGEAARVGGRLVEARVVDVLQEPRLDQSEAGGVAGLVGGDAGAAAYLAPLETRGP